MCKDNLMWETEEAGYRWNPFLHGLGVMKLDDGYMEVRYIILSTFVDALCSQLQNVCVHVRMCVCVCF